MKNQYLRTLIILLCVFGVMPSCRCIPSPVVIGCKWEHPVDLTDYINPVGTSVDAESIDLAMSDNGDAIIVWKGGSASQGGVFLSEYRSGSWSHPTSLSDSISPQESISPWGPVVYAPQVAMDNQGNAIVVWQQYDDDGTDQIFMSEYRNGIWSHPYYLRDNISPDGTRAFKPDVAMDNHGNAIIVWYQADEEEFTQIFISEYRDNGWRHPYSIRDNISPEDGMGAAFPRVAMSDAGNVVIVWIGYIDQDRMQVYMSEYDRIRWIHPEGSNDHISTGRGLALKPQVAMDGKGNAVVVWVDKTRDFGIMVNMSEFKQGEWNHPDEADDIISLHGHQVNDPQVVLDNNGNAIIVWKAGAPSSGNYMEIFVSEYRQGTWMHPDEAADSISIEGYGSTHSPQVAMDDLGNAIVVWVMDIIPEGGFDNLGYHYFLSEYKQGVWTHPDEITDAISPGDGNFWLSNPQVAMDNNKSAIVVWSQESDQGDSAIFMSEYRCRE